MDEQLKHKKTGLTGYGRLHLATPASTCTTVKRVTADTTYDIGTVATTETGPAAIAFPVAQGPIRIAGSAYLTGTLTALGLNNRAFYGLAMGTNPLDAALVQNNVIPLNELAPVSGSRAGSAARSRGGRAGRQDPVRRRLTDQRDVRRHGQPDSRCGRAAGHGRAHARRYPGG